MPPKVSAVPRSSATAMAGPCVVVGVLLAGCAAVLAQTAPAARLSGTWEGQVLLEGNWRFMEASFGQEGHGDVKVDLPQQRREFRDVAVHGNDVRWTLVRWSLSRRFGADSIQIRPATDGTDWRPLLDRRSSPGARVAQFSPDGNWVVQYNRDGLYRIATDGGEPQRLGDYPTPYISDSSLSISPDGRHFIVHAVRERGRWTGDFWVLENFLPPAPGIPAAVNKEGK